MALRNRLCSNTFLTIMVALLLRISSMRASARVFLSVDAVAAFTTLPDTFLSSHNTPTTPTTTQGLSNRFFSSAASKRPPKMYSRMNTVRRSMGKNGKLQVERLYRADRVLANRSGKSRSECFALLQEKRIWQAAATAAAAANTAETSTHISKSLIKGPAVKISMHTPLWIDKTESIPLPAPLLQVYHKPCWVLSVRSDPVGRPCLQGILPDMHPVGRLDYDTSGLLLFSSSGPLTQTLLHPKHNVSKEYVAVVTGRVDEEVLRAQFTAGVTTGEGVHTAELLQVEHWNSNNNDNDDNDDNNDTDDTAARNPNPSVTKFLQTVRKNMPAEYNQTDLKVRGYLDVFDATELTTVTLTVAEGKHRMVRRMLANCGHAVVALKRERLGAMELGDLAVGETRRLTPAELEWVEDQMPQKKSSKPYRKKKELSDADLESDSDGELE